MPPFRLGLLPDADFLEKPLVVFIKGFMTSDHETLEQSRSSTFNIEAFRISTREVEPT
jgi:hypothetical protein